MTEIPAPPRDPACVFCRIVGGELVADVVLETTHVVAFLDNRPLFPGHVLVVPRAHVPTLGDLPGDLIAPFFAAVQLLARGVEQGLRADGSFVAMNNRVSQSVPHLHAHVVPRRRKDGLKGFFWPRQPYRDAAEIADTRDRIRAAVAALSGGDA